MTHPLLAPPLLPLADAAGSTMGALPGGERAVDALAGVVLLLVVFAGVGCLFLVIRGIFPGPVGAADLTVGRMGTGRLLLSGVLPVVGAALLSWAVSYAPEPAQAVVVLLVGIPLALLTLLGGAAAVPHLGRLVLRAGGEPRLLFGAVTGAIVIGLGGAAAALLAREGGLVLYVMLVVSWFVGVGLGALRGGSSAPASPEEPPTDA